MLQTHKELRDISNFLGSTVTSVGRYTNYWFKVALSLGIDDATFIWMIPDICKARFQWLL